MSAFREQLAEGEGFEPSRRCYRLRDFQSRALGQAMRPFQRRRGWDSNPRRLITSPLFESGTFNHSDTSPTREVYQRSRAIRRRNGGRNSKTARQLPGGLSWYAWQDSNLRPLGPQPNALSPELQAQMRFCAASVQPIAAGREGFEPSEEIKAPSTA